ncbi:type III pantothenate kinase [Aliikangiella marina]|uniref:Type III pantothenate kinase n=1 Tax=Aliikangiella marina TaxID=1712262 RepID=A0A545T9I2_9GAMM|nr:type III pantothenate kinase [Aliikangiella marina]TQV73872.1 type III pantothenate kinase [Aliikangiella marina]
MVLLIDWGNTRLKWMKIDHLELAQVRAAKVNITDNWQEHTEIWASPIEAIFIASVRNDQDNQALSGHLLNYCDRIHFAKTEQIACGVENSYSDPETMGVDRWMGVIAAAAPEENIAVVSIGSAITLDVIQSAQHMGGHIVPGRRLMLESLNTTGRVRPLMNTQDDESFHLGQTTNDCVNAGINSMIEGYLRHIINQTKIEYQVSRFIFAGGGGKYWQQRLNSGTDQMEYSESLVFEGLVKRYSV